MLRIAILMGRSFTDERGMPEVVRLLGELGAAARLLHLGDDLIDVARVRLDYDLYVLKNRNDLGMSVAADLHSFKKISWRRSSASAGFLTIRKIRP